MQFLIIGVILLIAFGLLTILLLQYAHTNWYRKNLEEGRPYKNFSKNPLNLDSTNGDKVVFAVEGIKTKIVDSYQSLQSKLQNGEKTEKVSMFLEKTVNLILFVFNKFSSFIRYLLSLSKPIKEEEYYNNLKNKYVPGSNSVATNQRQDKEEILSHDEEQYFRSQQQNIQKKAVETNKENFENRSFNKNMFTDRNVNLRENFIKNLNIHSNQENQINEEEEMEFYQRKEEKLIGLISKGGENKFLYSLELGDLYGKIGNYEEQKELYLWVMEKAMGKEKELATQRIIAMR
jgi:hypothetical protein